jgi:alpha-beta hydrolase superfamily lysophospholipase
MSEATVAPVVEPEQFTVTDADGETITVYRWRPPGRATRAVHLLHGMGEHARRYDRLAGELVSAGWQVSADDHRASGRTGAEGPGLGDLGPRGMRGALGAVGAVLDAVAEPEVPLVLLGHSWGSFLAQRIALGDGMPEGSTTILSGLILSGSTLLVPEYLPNMDSNAPFEPAATPYDWLSRDPVEVQKYINDPWCGFEVAFPVEELFHLAGPPDDRIPAGLPILVINGSNDAVGGPNGGGAALAQAYRDLGSGDATYLEYEGGRHELFNETNRDEVTADVVGWLATHVKS